MSLRYSGNIKRRNRIDVIISAALCQDIRVIIESNVVNLNLINVRMYERE